MSNPSNGESVFGIYSDSGRELLCSLIDELKEQWAIGGYQSQFIYWVSRASDTRLAEPVVAKWLKVLSNSCALRFCRPSYELETLRDMILAGKKIDPLHEWGGEVTTTLLLENELNTSRLFLIDVSSVDFELLKSRIMSKFVSGEFTIDKIGRISYRGRLLEQVEKSRIQKKILQELLLANDNILSASEVRYWFDSDADGNKRSTAISKLNKELRRVSDNNARIVSHFVGNSVDYYELVSK